MNDDPHEFAKSMLAAQMAPPSAPREGNPEGVAWVRFQRERRAFHMWLSKIEPSLPLVFWPEPTNPSGLTFDQIYDKRDEMRRDILSMLDALYGGDRLEAWRQVGKPPALRYYAGIRTAPPTEKEWDFEMYYDSGEGVRPSDPSMDGRCKAVREVATNSVWQSVASLAEELGVSRVYVSQHLGGRVKSVKGRVFQYVE